VYETSVNSDPDPAGWRVVLLAAASPQERDLFIDMLYGAPRPGHRRKSPPRTIPPQEPHEGPCPPCGTRDTYQHHWRYGEELDDRCRQANAREQRRRHKYVKNKDRTG
jgi:hypothetical protein